MKLWPVDTYLLESALSVEDVVRRLQNEIEPARFLRKTTGHRPFVGAIRDGRFVIRPRRWKQSSFMPEIHGSFKPSNQGTIVEIKMVPSGSVLAIVALLSGFSGLMIFRLGTWVVLAVAGSVLVSWLACIAGFWLDSERSRQTLVRVLAASDGREATVPQTEIDRMPSVRL